MAFVKIPSMDIGPGDDEWTLAGEMVYVTQAGDLIEIPAGFVTDLATIPRLLQWIVTVNGRHRAAAVVHDWLYEKQGRPRTEADRLFREAMDDSGVRLTQRWAMWAAVRVGGWLPWGRRARLNFLDRVEP